MTDAARRVQRTYLLLTLLSTLSASFIWGINTLFLLDAGLNNAEAFAANAFFTAGMVLFEIPTGIVADIRGRRTSFLLGTVTLAASTALYVLLWHMHAPFWQWAVVSVLLGLGFTFFSGATEAWLVDALNATGYEGALEAVFGRGQVITGVGMLAGSVGGGYLAQVTNLGVPFVVRALILALMFVVALMLMHDIGFEPARGVRPIAQIRRITADSVEYGLKVPVVRYLMLAGVFTGGVGIYVFYALQPYLLELYGDQQAYGIAGLVAAIVAGAQIVGGFSSASVRRLFARRTSALLAAEALATVAILVIGVVGRFWVVILLIVVWAVVDSAARPIRQAFLNALIPSQQRATILSFDSMMASSGGVVAQPLLGRAADVWGYPASYVISGGLSAAAIPLVALARRQRATADTASNGG